MREKMFGDLERMRVQSIKEKLEAGFSKFELDSRIQWNSVRLEKPLFETLLRIVNEELKKYE